MWKVFFFFNHRWPWNITSEPKSALCASCWKYFKEVITASSQTDRHSYINIAQTNKQRQFSVTNILLGYFYICKYNFYCKISAIFYFSFCETWKLKTFEIYFTYSIKRSQIFSNSHNDTSDLSKCPKYVNFF